MKKILAFPVFVLAIFIFAFYFFVPAEAADIRAGENISISENEENLSDLYLFGNSVTLGAPVKNDLVVGGRDVLIENLVSGNIIAGGGSLRIKGESGSIKAAGGNVVIDGNVERDVVVGGGSVVVSKTAKIAGDLIIAGGDLTIDGVVNGRALVNGGQVRINGKIGKNVEGNVGKLTVGSAAVIGGDLVYSSGEKATVASGARIAGAERFRYVAQTKKVAAEAGSFITGFSIYKLIVDVVLAIGIIYFFGGFLKLCFAKSVKSPLLSGVFGFAFLLLVPGAAMILLALLWLGAGVFIFYLLMLLVATYAAKAFTGWAILKWWYQRDKKVYVLDWKAGVIGPIVLFIVALIPFLGWLAVAILYLVSLGAFVWELSATFNNQRLSVKKK